MIRTQYANRSDWLEARKIGGSDAGVILGVNRYKSINDLYLEKIGAKTTPDLSKKSRVQHGVASEPLLREIFKINFPEYEMYYREFEILSDENYPWRTASLDGELHHQILGRGVWECKTSEPRDRKSWQAWNGRIPDSYYCQLLHNMDVAEKEFAILTAQLIHRPISDDPKNLLWTETRNYFFSREDCESDITYLKEEEINFWKNHIEPRIAPDVRIKLGE